MKSILAKIKANKFRSAMIGTCIFLFGFITVTVFSNINDTYAVETVCPVGWYLDKYGSKSACCPPNYEYDGKYCSLAGRIGKNYKTCPYGRRGDYDTCWISGIQPQPKACYACGGTQGATYKWGNYSLSSNCNKVSKYSSEGECLNKNNNASSDYNGLNCYYCASSGEYNWTTKKPSTTCPGGIDWKVASGVSKTNCQRGNACYLCGDSKNGIYKWGLYGDNSSCTYQKDYKNSSSCTSKNTKTLSATFNVTNGGTLNGNASGSCTTSQASPNSCKTTAPTATRSGYYLKGWSTSSSCTSVRTTSSNNSITLDNSFSGSLYTCWGEKGQDAGGYASGSSTAENPQPGTPGGDTSGETTTAYTRKIYNITYDLDGGKFIDGSTKRIVSALGDSNLSEPQTNPIKDGVKFKEWQLNGTKFDFGQKPTSDMTLKAVYEELTDEDKLYYCENGILDQSTKTCYNVMKQDESKGLYDHSIYTYKEGSTFCYAYDKENNKPGGVNFRVNDNDFNMDNYKTITGRQENDDYSSSGYPELETWVSSDTCLIATECTEASNINRPTCEVRVDLIAYSKDGTLIKSDDSNEDGINIPIDSDDNKSDKTNDEIDKNSKTGDALIQFVWIIGICALGYSIYYFKNKKQEN